MSHLLRVAGHAEAVFAGVHRVGRWRHASARAGRNTCLFFFCSRRKTYKFLQNYSFSFTSHYYTDSSTKTAAAWRTTTCYRNERESPNEIVSRPQTATDSAWTQRRRRQIWKKKCYILNYLIDVIIIVLEMTNDGGIHHILSLCSPRVELLYRRSGGEGRWAIKTFRVRGVLKKKKS